MRKTPKQASHQQFWRSYGPNPAALLARYALSCCLAFATIAAFGCQIWPFREVERTSIVTPAMRTAAIREIAPRSRNADAAEKQKICEQLALQIQTEPDPIVRRAIQETIAEFDTPLADQVLLAGLQDDDRDVRLACCRKLGERGKPESIGALARLIAEDQDVDIQLAAVDAVGLIASPEAVKAIAPALDSRNPAMQYAGVQAMRNVSDEKVVKDFGNDVAAWRQYAAEQSPASQTPAENSAATIAAKSAETTSR